MTCRLRQHLLIHISTRKYSCKLLGCSKKFKATQHLEYHMTTHEASSKRFLCTYLGCSKDFKTFQILEDHFKKHQNDFKFSCEQHGCHKQYNTRSNYEVHLRSHAGVKPFECQMCHQKFISKWNMTKHLNLVDCPSLKSRNGKYISNDYKDE